MKYAVLLVALTMTLLSPGVVIAKAHHTPMAAPIECHGNFNCLHPGFVAAVKEARNTITSWQFPHESNRPRACTTALSCPPRG
jgi:hypothetical protein